MIRRCLASLAFLCGLFVLSAEADDTEKEKKAFGKGIANPEAIFKKIDENNDDKLSKDEFKKFFEEVSKGKLEGKGGGQFSERIFQTLDTDSDGKLTLDEFKKISELREKFGKDGKLSPEKLKELKEKLGGKLDPEKLKELKEKLGGKIDPEKLKELIEKRKVDK